MLNLPDILAPAGGMDSLVAGVNSGADAVYMGWSQLNARRNAKNFTTEEFLQGAAYCHARGVKVYMTLNTTVYDREFTLVREALQLACQAGVTGIIVQDMGIAALARQLCPQLPLHGSTQMVVHSLSGALALRELGYDCAVLARELTGKEIACITKESGIPTEIFVHGALCMCVSGQCYMSAMIGERSGNRGMCAQACRLPFSPTGNREEYALSLKDACLIPKLGEIAQMGVSTLKIEGRMKRPEYVAAAVDACRKALDGQPVDYNALQSVFSRSGFTTGYYDGKLSREMFGVRSKEDVTAAGEVLRQMQALYKGEYPRVPLDFTLTLKAECPAVLTVSDRQRTVVVEGEIPQEAISRPTDEEMAAKALSKLGGTYYRMNSLTCHFGEGLMLPVSALNALRRQGLEQLSKLRENPASIPFDEEKPMPEYLPRKKKGKPALRAVCSKSEQLTAQIEEACQFISLPIEEIDKADIPRLKEKLIVQLPHVCFGDDIAKLSPKLTSLREQGITRLSTCHIGGVYLGRKLGFTVHGDYGLNITNTHALAAYREMGLEDAVVSYELSLKRVKGLGNVLPIGILAYGRLPLMVTRSCPLDNNCKKCGGRSLTDRTKARFPVRCYEEYKEILNSAPLYLADRLEELEGLDFLTLLFTDEPPAHCNDILSAYLHGGEKREGITRGLYFRNVQ